ncbi:interferon-related developmental regulator-domain-containing protein [Geopyxis carbonaria]|nr:interferon-related developmental regulator-domain-containing protein [Geopyxis carbonaria]
MSELRRKALAPGGKTISRKAASRQSSTTSSRATSRQASRQNSRAASRANSEDEDAELSDETTFSYGSQGDFGITEYPEDSNSAWQEELGDTVQAILERKKSSFASREESFNKYVHILCAKYAKEAITHQKTGIVDSCLRSIKSGRTEKESLLATKALALTIVSAPDDEIYDAVSPTFKRVISDHESMPLKCSVIHALGAATFYGGATLTETENVMDFLLEIIQSDGHSVGAGDEAGVVTSALEEWGFLCTQLDDAEDITAGSMDALVDQLDSSEVSVQVAAGENIALLYEKSYTEAEEDELDDRHEAGSKFIQRYKPYPRVDSLKETLSNLSGGSRKYLSKRNKKTQQSAFSDILHSVEEPLKGPRFRETLDSNGNIRGSKLTVRVHRTGVLRVDKWWKLLRVQHLRRLLSGGFLTHWTENPVIFESLSLFVESI